MVVTRYAVMDSTAEVGLKRVLGIGMNRVVRVRMGRFEKPGAGPGSG